MDNKNNENGSQSQSNSQINEIRQSQYETIERYYAELRKNYGPNNQWEDPDFGPEKNDYFTEKDENNDVELERITFDDDKDKGDIDENDLMNLN